MIGVTSPSRCVRMLMSAAVLTGGCGGLDPAVSDVADPDVVQSDAFLVKTIANPGPSSESHLGQAVADLGDSLLVRANSNLYRIDPQEGLASYSIPIEGTFPDALAATVVGNNLWLGLPAISTTTSNTDQWHAGVVALHDRATGRPFLLDGKAFRIRSPNAVAGGRFGQRLVTDGRRVFISEPFAPTGTGWGRVHVFDVVNRSFVATLTSPSPQALIFGEELAVDGSWLLVVSSSADPGSARVDVFDIATARWSHTLALPSGARIQGFSRLAAHAGRVLVDLVDDVGVFDVATGECIRVLPYQGASPYFEFGAALAWSGSDAVVADPSSRNANGTYGAVYVFRVADARLLQRIETPVPYYGDFGRSLIVRGSRLYVGAPLVRGPNFSEPGAIFVYAR